MNENPVWARHRSGAAKRMAIWMGFQQIVWFYQSSSESNFSLPQACNGLPAISKDKIRAVVDKVRELLPRPAPSPVMPPPTAPAPKGVPGGRPRTAPDTDEPNSESAEKPVEKPAEKSVSRPKTAPSSRRGSAAPTKKKEEEPTGPPLLVNENKAQRFRDEQKRRLLKWEFTGPSKEHMTQLATLVEDNCSPELVTMMFHSDFKHHIKAIEAMNKQLEVGLGRVGKRNKLTKCRFHFFTG